MAKVSIKSGKLTPFGGIYFVNKAFNALSLGDNIPGRHSNTSMVTSGMKSFRPCLTCTCAEATMWRM